MYERERRASPQLNATPTMLHTIPLILAVIYVAIKQWNVDRSAGPPDGFNLMSAPDSLRRFLRRHRSKSIPLVSPLLSLPYLPTLTLSL